MRCFNDVSKIAKHRANDASNDVHRPPLAVHPSIHRRQDDGAGQARQYRPGSGTPRPTDGNSWPQRNDGHGDDGQHWQDDHQCSDDGPRFSLVVS